MSVEDLKAKLEANVPAPEAPRTHTPLRDAIAAFERHEAQTVPGAPSRGQKADLLRADEAMEKNPDAHLRWVSPQKAESRRNDGYVALSSVEGGKSLGNELILMGIPKQEYDRRVAELKVKTEARLKAHVGEMQSTVEAIVREARDRHGLTLDIDRLMKP